MNEFYLGNLTPNLSINNNHHNDNVHNPQNCPFITENDVLNISDSYTVEISQAQN